MSFFKSFIYSILWSSLISCVVGVTLAGIVYTRVSGTEIDLNKLKIAPRPTIIYDKDGNVMASFSQTKEENTLYKEIPTTVQDALISTEDRDFYQHPGINVKGIMRALVTDLKTHDFSQGGSTITQQLVKNMYLTNEKDLTRKIKEAVMATALEQKLSKQEILTQYLNHIFYGNQAYGIKNAVMTYYGETLQQLEKENKIDQITKSALVVGLAQLPSAYDPYLHPDKALARRNIVLSNMLNQGFITQSEYEQAVKKDFMILKQPNIIHKDDFIHYGEVVTYVLHESANELNISEDEVKNSGAKIYTSFDPKVYQIIRDKFSQDYLFPSNAHDGTKVEGSMTIVNPKNGEIIAMTGGREQPQYMGLNRAYQTFRQPGSGFKPIVDYGPAIESGKFNPWSVLIDQPGYDFGGGYQPHDFGTPHGRITMINAITISQNIPAVYLLQQTGISYAKQYASRLGIDLSKENSGLSMGLGGLDHGVSTLQMSDAYQAYANGGYRVPAHIIRRVVSYDGDIIYESSNAISDKFRVIKESTAIAMRYMMRSVVTSGTGTLANISGALVAGKTGTTEMPGIPGHNKDIWFNGFTPSFVGSIWMGFDNTDRSHNLGVTSYVAAKMFGEIANEVADLYPSPNDQVIVPKRAKTETVSVNLTGSYSDKQKAVVLTFNNKDGIAYTIYRDGQVIDKGIKDGTYTDKDVKNGEQHDYKITGFDDLGGTNYESNTVTVQIGSNDTSNSKQGDTNNNTNGDTSSKPVKAPAPKQGTDNNNNNDNSGNNNSTDTQSPSDGQGNTTNGDSTNTDTNSQTPNTQTGSKDSSTTTKKP